MPEMQQQRAPDPAVLLNMFDVLCVGHASYDVTMSVAHHPGPDEKTAADAMNLAGGGPAANAAVQVARLGGATAFCGYLGNDILGEAHLGELAAEGVDTSLLVRGVNPSPVSQVLAKPDGSRSVVNYKGDTAWLAADAVDFSALQTKVLLFDGHEPLLSVAGMAWAQANGMVTMLDAGSLHRGTRELAPRVGYLAASAGFAREFAATDDMQLALQRLREQCATVIITLGNQGLLWASSGGSGSLPAFKVSAVDSTGAGDAFHGALALALAREMAWPDALAFASAAGALSCTRLGARAALPDAAAVSGLLKQSDSGACRP